MRLLASECRRLWRPLLAGTSLCVVAVGLLLTRGGALAASGAKLSGTSRAVLAHDLAFTSPTGVGRVAADLMSSLPGVVAMLVLAGSHVAGEWPARTLKSVLLQDGRRWRWVTGKLVSLWLAGVAIELGLWAALAAWTIPLRTWWPAPRTWDRATASA